LETIPGVCVKTFLDNGGGGKNKFDNIYFSLLNDQTFELKKYGHDFNMGVKQHTP